jgi:hypothetical protein
VKHAGTEHREIVARYVKGRQVLDLPVDECVHAGIGSLIGGESRKHRHVRFPREELGNRRVQVVGAPRWIVGDDDLHDPVGVGIGQRSEQQTIGDGKDCRVGADRHREDGDGGDRETTRVAQRASGMAQVGGDTFESGVHIRTLAIPF